MVRTIAPIRTITRIAVIIRNFFEFLLYIKPLSLTLSCRPRGRSFRRPERKLRMLFPCLTVVLILSVLLAIRYAHNRHSQQNGMEEFWEREKAAETAPAQDITNLPYLIIPLDKFPLNFTDDEEVALMEEELSELAEKKILKLTHLSNTDLRLTYGAANFDVLSKAGDNYDRLVVLLCDYARAIMERGRPDLALPVLEYGASIRSDVSANYLLLGECFRDMAAKNPTERSVWKEKMRSLIDLVSSEKMILSGKDSLIVKLEEISGEF